MARLKTLASYDYNVAITGKVVEMAHGRSFGRGDSDVSGRWILDWSENHSPIKTPARPSVAYCVSRKTRVELGGKRPLLQMRNKTSLAAKAQTLSGSMLERFD